MTVTEFCAQQKPRGPGDNARFPRGLSILIGLLVSTVPIGISAHELANASANKGQSQTENQNAQRPDNDETAPPEPARQDASATNNPPDQKRNEVGQKLGLETIVVTPTRSSERLLDTPQKVDVIQRDDFIQRGDYTIENLFRYTPGIEVSQQTSGTDPFDSNGGIEIRGVGGNRTQILVDGSRTLERITDGTRDVVEASNVKRVEVVRGPASVLWGSDGLGGVVNFVTRDPVDVIDPERGWGTDGAVTYNSLNDALVETATLAARFNKSSSGLISYTRRDTNERDRDKARIGPNAIQPCPRPPEAAPCNRADPKDISSNSVLGKVVLDVSQGLVITMTGEYFDRENEVNQQSALGPQFSNFTGEQTSTRLVSDRVQETERWRAGIDLEWAPGFNAMDSLKLSLDYTPQSVFRTGLQESIDFNSGDRLQSIPDLDFEEKFFEVDLQANSSFELGGTQHALTYGFDGDLTQTDRERVNTDINVTQGTTVVTRGGGFDFADADTTRADVYIQDNIKFSDGRFSLLPAVRVATYEIDPKPDVSLDQVPGAEPQEISETDVQLKIGALAELTDTWSVYANFGEGFKMPTAQQLFQSLDSLPFFALIPNPDLKPESVDSYELGVRGNWGARGYLSLNGFFADYDDFIQNFEEIDPTRFGLPEGALALTFDNVDSVEISGIEAEGLYNLTDSFYIAAAASWQDGERTDDGETSEFLNALPLQWVQTLGYRTDRFSIDINATLQAEANKVNDPDAEFLPDSYAVFDISARYAVTDSLELRANAFNLFDERYFPAESVGFPINASEAVQRVNPVEAQVAPGRNFSLAMTLRW